MNEVLAIYDFLNNYGIVTLIRIAIGIILILNKKSISILNNKNTPKRFKFALVTTYYAVILWCMFFGWIYPSMKSVILGIIVGIVFSFIIVKYSATEHMAGWIFLFISFYEIAEFVFYGLDISFAEILKSNSYIYDDFDYDTVKVKIAVALFLTVVSYVLLKKKDKWQIIEEEKYFGIGIYFILGTIFAAVYDPFSALVQAPSDWKELCIPLLNINYDKECFGIPLNVICVATLYRAFKRVNMGEE